MTSCENDFDGRLIALVDRDMMPESAQLLMRDQIFFATNNSPPHIHPGLFLRLSKDEGHTWLPPWEKSLEDSIDEKVDPAILEIFFEGRVQMNFLLKTGGGQKMVTDYYDRAIDRIKKNRGSVDVYVGDEALSAGANIFMRSHGRYALESSRLMWHAPTLTAGAQYLSDTRRIIREARDSLKNSTSVLAG